MRPKTIVYFERIIFGALLLGVLQDYLDWNQVIAWLALSLSVFLVQSITRGVPLGSNMNIIMSALHFVAEVVAYGLLFTSSARRWMRREDKLLEVFH